jgi:hypothetical protein
VHQAWWQSGSGKDDDDDYQPMHEFGYAVLGELSRLVMESPVEAGRALWEPAFALGAKGHYAIGHFLSSWFTLVTEHGARRVRQALAADDGVLRVE